MTLSKLGRRVVGMGQPKAWDSDNVWHGLPPLLVCGISPPGNQESLGLA